ncbi:MAG: hypothetical protein AAGI90_04500 [Chlamydiota bacterium]
MKVIDVANNSLSAMWDLDTTNFGSSSRNKRIEEFLNPTKNEFHIPRGGPIYFSTEGGIQSSLNSRKQVCHLGAEDQSSHRISELFKQALNIQI